MVCAKRTLLLLTLISALTGADELWQDDLGRGIAAAEERDCPMIVLWSIPGCTWCDRMIAESGESPAVRTALAQTVALHLDAEDHPALAAQLSLRSFPTVMLVNRKREITRMIPGYLAPADLATAIRVHILHGDAISGETLGAAALDIDAIARGEDAVPQLVALLGQGPTAQRAAVRAALMGLPAARDALWDVLDHVDLAVRVDAAAVLADLAGPPLTYDPFEPSEARQAARREWQAGTARSLIP